jgi:hypothetical protein
MPLFFLNSSLGARELREFFENHELEVVDVQFVSDKNAIRHKGTAYVEYDFEI